MKMKITSKTLSLVALISAALIVWNCGGDDSKTPVEKVQLDKLSKTWNLVSATINGSPSGQIDPDFTLTITGTYNKNSPEGPYTFNASGTQTPSPWPQSGKWFFGPDPKAMLLRDENVNSTLDTVGDLAMTYNINSNGQLTIQFHCDECDYDGARTNNVNGSWVFILD
jgi:hypothetical protein